MLPAASRVDWARPRRAGEAVHERGLARAVGSDDAAQLAGLDDHAQGIEGFEAVEAHRHAREIEDGTLRRVEVHAGSFPRKRPIRPPGSQRVRALKENPSTYSHASGNAPASQRFTPST